MNPTRVGSILVASIRIGLVSAGLAQPGGLPASPTTAQAQVEERVRDGNRNDDPALAPNPMRAQSRMRPMQVGWLGDQRPDRSVLLGEAVNPAARAGDLAQDDSTEAGGAWSVRLYRWDRTEGAPVGPPGGATRADQERAWKRILASPPIFEGRREQLDLQWGNGASVPGGPEDSFATVATADLELPAGKYRISTNSDDGIRVKVDGKIVLEAWSPHVARGEEAVFTLFKGGTHRCRVEHYEIDGWAVLQARIDAIPVPPAPVARPATAACEQALRALRVDCSSLYHAAYKSRTGARELAQELLSRQDRLDTGAPLRWTLLVQARKYAAKACDVATVVRSIDALAQSFRDVDRKALLRENLERAARAARSPEHHRDLATAYRYLARIAFAAGDFDLTTAALKYAHWHGSKPGAMSEKQLDEIRFDRLLASRLQRYLRVKPGKTPDPSPAAALRQALRGKWDEALSILATSPKRALRETATADLQNPATAKQQLELGVRWLELARKQKHKVRRPVYLARAAFRLEQALTGLRGVWRRAARQLLADARDGLGILETPDRWSKCSFSRDPGGRAAKAEGPDELGPFMFPPAEELSRAREVVRLAFRAEYGQPLTDRKGWETFATRLMAQGPVEDSATRAAIFEEARNIAVWIGDRRQVAAAIGALGRSFIDFDEKKEVEQTERTLKVLAEMKGRQHAAGEVAVCGPYQLGNPCPGAASVIVLARRSIPRSCWQRLATRSERIPSLVIVGEAPFARRTPLILPPRLDGVTWLTLANVTISPASFAQVKTGKIGWLALLNCGFSGTDPVDVRSLRLRGLQVVPSSDRVANPFPASRRALRRTYGGEGIGEAVEAGLQWLAKHQAPEEGYWDCDGFQEQCQNNICEGKGLPHHDPGITGLALLAFLVNGHAGVGGFGETVTRGLTYLKKIQAPDGCFGPQHGSYMYGHAIAAQAVCRAYDLTGDPALRQSARMAVSFLVAAQNRDRGGAGKLGWRYTLKPGDNDTSVTGWVIMALKSAEQAGLEVPREAFVGAKVWIDEMTDPATGRTGYIQSGVSPIRYNDACAKWPRTKSEAITAAAVLARVLIGQDPARSTAIRQGVKLCLERLPKWNEGSGSIDHYYWYHGTLAMFQVGGRPWVQWNRAMKKAIVDHQRKDGCEKGSWDPDGPWGKYGGRVYSTSLMVLTLSVYYTYGKIFASR